MRWRVSSAEKIYLQILFLAATESESGVEAALGVLLAAPATITKESVQGLLNGTEADSGHVDLSAYDLAAQPAMEVLS